MNYELAKELKDAGFPNTRMKKEPPMIINNEMWISPTLSELIEACGDYLALWKSSYDNRWRCSLSEDGAGYDDKYIDNDYFCHKTSGNTPEEAVARLYLQLKRASVK